jgi:predicted GH43/DUF377 family glycosyl hydrolase
MDAAQRPRFWPFFLAGGLAAVAMLGKMTSLAVCGAALAAVWQARGHRLRSVLAFSLGLTAVWVLAVGAARWTGVWDSGSNALLHFNALYGSASDWAGRLKEGHKLLDKLIHSPLVLGMLGLILLGAAGIARKEIPSRGPAWVLAGGALMELGLSCLAGNSYLHYLIALIPLLGAVAGVALCAFAPGMALLDAWATRWGAFALAALLCWLTLHGADAALRPYNAGDQTAYATHCVLRQVQPGRPGWVWGAEAGTYVGTGRRAPNRFVYAYPLFARGYLTEAEGRDYLASLMAAQPALLVDASGHTNFMPSLADGDPLWRRGGSPVDRSLYAPWSGMSSLREWVRQEYHRVGVISPEGWGLYARREATRSEALPVSRPIVWVKDPRSPVLGPGMGTCFDACLQKEAGGVRMWFSWRDRGCVATARSADGVLWNEVRECVGPDLLSGWERIANRPTVLRTRVGYQMWYTGQYGLVGVEERFWPSLLARWRHDFAYHGLQSAIGHATSRDGVAWRREEGEGPVLAPKQSWEKRSVMCPEVLEDPLSGGYRMWYSGGELNEPDAIGYATSQDGAQWTRLPRPVFSSAGGEAWERRKVTACQVMILDGWHYMFYIGFDVAGRAAIGLARSRNGISGWQRYPGNPILSPTPGGFDADGAYKPYVLRFKGRWMLWYNGRRGRVEQIGLASCDGKRFW